MHDEVALNLAPPTDLSSGSDSPRAPGPLAAWRQALCCADALAACALFALLEAVPPLCFAQHTRQPPYQTVADGAPGAEAVLVRAGFINQPYVAPSAQACPAAWLIAICALVPLGVWLALSLAAPARGAVKGYALGYAHAMMLARLVVNSTKRYVGYWRPYFYDECDFADDAPYDCDHSARGDDMYKSFPSGHAAMSMCALLHTSWVLLGRARLAESARGAGCRPCAKAAARAADDDEARRRVLDPTSFKIAACLCPAFLAWWIAASRVYDNDHHPADVVGGAVIGGSFASLFYFRHFPSIFAVDAHVPWGYGG